jgi:hypothetical protein
MRVEDLKHLTLFEQSVILLLEQILKEVKAYDE